MTDVLRDVYRECEKKIHANRSETQTLCLEVYFHKSQKQKHQQACLLRRENRYCYIINAIVQTADYVSPLPQFPFPERLGWGGDGLVVLVVGSSLTRHLSLITIAN